MPACADLDRWQARQRSAQAAARIGAVALLHAMPAARVHQAQLRSQHFMQLQMCMYAVSLALECADACVNRAIQAPALKHA